MQKRYTPITPAQLAGFRAQAAANGITVPEGNSGIVTVSVPFGSIKIAFNYDGTNLDLHILGEPFFVSSSDVWAKLDGYLTSAA